MHITKIISGNKFEFLVYVDRSIFVQPMIIIKHDFN